jgi:hypothetical protein
MKRAVLATLVLLLCACKPKEVRRGVETVKIDACTLVTKEEVAAIQSAPITSALSNDVPINEFVMSQCYYASSAPDMSASISVTQADPKRPPETTVREYWHQTFDRFNAKEEAATTEPEEKPEKGKRDAGREEEEKEHAIHLPKIEGIGDEAYWAGSKVGGTLYVLKDEKMLRVSVGGLPNQETKLEKSKALASKALSRLSK